MPDRITRSRCVPVDQRLDQVINVVENIVDNGLTYTAGCGIEIVDTEISAAVDGVTVICEDGVLKSVAASDLTAGCGIDITGGEVSVTTDGTSIDCVGGNLTVIAYAFGKIVIADSPDVDADQVVDTLTLVADFGINISAAGDTITFAVDVSDVAQAAFTTIVVSGQSSVLADSPIDILTLVAGPGHTITTDAGNDTITHKADVHDASHVGLVDPTTGDDSTADDAQIGILWHEIQDYTVGRNLLLGHLEDDAAKPVVQYKTTEDWLERLEDYDAIDRMVIGNDPDGTGVENDENVKWIPSPQKVIWGIDPDGGHTITTVGTTMTVTLKALKHTFDAVNWVSSVAEDIEITYTGTECP